MQTIFISGATGEQTQPSVDLWARWLDAPPPSDATPLLPQLVLASIFSDARADADDVPGEAARGGWWADAYPGPTVEGDRDDFGSRLWTLARAGLTQPRVVETADMVREALQWMIADELAADVRVSAQRVGASNIRVHIELVRGDARPDVVLIEDDWREVLGAAA